MAPHCRHVLSSFRPPLTVARCPPQPLPSARLASPRRVFRHLSIRRDPCSTSSSSPSPRPLSSRTPTTIRPSFQTRPITTVPTCPPPSCGCFPFPSSQIPADKPIDHTSPLTNTVPSYKTHILLSTGQSDWSSKIEADTSPSLLLLDGTNAAAELKRLLRSRPPSEDEEQGGGGGGVMVSCGSFPPSPTYFAPRPRVEEPPDSERSPWRAPLEMHIFPRGKVVRNIPPTAKGLEKFLERHLHPRPQWEWGGREGGGNMVEEDVVTPTVLICSHASRDVRCGVLGPLLETEFRRTLGREGFLVGERPGVSGEGGGGGKKGGKGKGKGKGKGVSVGLVSHVGGHKWAGNVIVYFPPILTREVLDGIEDGQEELAGRGVWYGRVEPRHVEGIVNETIVGGRVIEELCRGIV